MINIDSTMITRVEENVRMSRSTLDHVVRVRELVKLKWEESVENNIE